MKFIYWKKKRDLSLIKTFCYKVNFIKAIVKSEITKKRNFFSRFYVSKIIIAPAKLIHYQLLKSSSSQFRNSNSAPLQKTPTNRCRSRLAPS
jgi:hypothetical protein